jgi:hypothetical protein
MRVDLNVPYSEKDYVKSKGARWDPVKKTWYIENAKNLYPLLKFMDKKYTMPTKSKPLHVYKSGKKKA